jgi:hypothetical protein
MVVKKGKGLSIPTKQKVINVDAAEDFGNKSITEVQKSHSKTKTKPSVKKEVVKVADESSATKRDAFTMPIFDYDLISELITRSAMNGRVLNKSEILRAGLIALNSMTDIQFKKAASKVIKIKTGRPSGS